MIPAGYMTKRVIAKPEWIDASGVQDILSVSGCVSKNFANNIQFWKHNEFCFFDSPQIIEELARVQCLSIAGCDFFYYEVFEDEFDEKSDQWRPFSPPLKFPADVVAPGQSKLMGYDVVSFVAQECPECLPLSCNSLASSVPTNEHCLLMSIDDARRLIAEGQFRDSEPGPLRIFSVSTLSAEKIE